MFTKTAKSEVYKNLRKFLEIYKNYTTEVYKNHRKSDVYKNRIFFEIYKFTRVNFTKTVLPRLYPVRLRTILIPVAHDEEP